MCSLKPLTSTKCNYELYIKTFVSIKNFQPLENTVQHLCPLKWYVLTDYVSVKENLLPEDLFTSLTWGMWGSNLPNGPQ